MRGAVRGVRGWRGDVAERGGAEQEKGGGVLEWAGVGRRKAGGGGGCRRVASGRWVGRRRRGGRWRGVGGEGRGVDDVAGIGVGGGPREGGKEVDRAHEESETK